MASMETLRHMFFARRMIAAACGLAILFCSLLLAAEPKNITEYDLAVVADRAEPFYKPGEKVTFTVTLKHQGQPFDSPKIKWVISNDGYTTIQEGVSPTKDGRLTLTGTLQAPGFLQCRADVAIPGQKIPSARAGAAFDPTQIKPSMPAPQDFDAYWAAQKQKLAAIPLNIRLKSVKSTAKEVECFDLQADGINGPLSAYLARPIGAKPKSLPAIVLTHGAGVTNSRLGSAIEWAKEGLIALDFNAHGLPNDKPKEFYAKLTAGELNNYPKKGVESRETIFFYTLFLRLQRAIDVITAQPEWDGKELIVNGRSQGGGQALAAGGLDPRVTFLAAQIPALCDHTGIVASRINGWPKFPITDEAGKPVPALLENVRYFDAVNFAARTKGGAFVTVGFIDVTCPPTSVYAAFNALPSPKQMLTHYDTGHVARADADQAVKAAILRHLKKH